MKTSKLLKMAGYVRGDTKSTSSPCASCEGGWANYSSAVDENGDFWGKSESCFDTCEKIKKWGDEVVFKTISTKGN